MSAPAARPRIRRTIAALAAVAGVTAGLPALAQAAAASAAEPPTDPPVVSAPSYEVVDLGLDPAIKLSTVQDLNDVGQVLLTGYDWGTTYFGVWENGQVRQLGTGHASAISDTGRIVGTHSSGGYYSYQQAAAWDSVTGARTDLGTLPADSGYGSTLESRACDVNSGGTIVGWSRGYTAAEGLYDAGVIFSGGGVTDLGTFNGERILGACPINEAGDFLAYTQRTGHTTILVVQGGAPTELPGFIGSLGIADDGTVLGQTAEGAALWKGGVTRQLQGLVPGGYVGANAISGNGAVIGTGEDAEGSYSAPVLWPAGSTTPVDLRTRLVPGSGWTLHNVGAINDQGWITALASAPDKPGRTVILKPVKARPVIDDVTLQQPAVPSGDLVDLPATGTIEGNTVRVGVELVNPSEEDADVELDVWVDGQQRTLTPVTATILGLGRETVTYDVDTTGLAWDGTTATPEHELEVIVSSGSEVLGSQKVALKVRPRPAILVHGFNADATTWDAYPGILHAVNPTWPVYAVGDGQAPGVMNTGSLTSPDTPANTIIRNGMIVDEYVTSVRDQLDAQYVDLVAHSMGGLISRQYIETSMDRTDGENVVNQLIMLGTPNHGSPCASLMRLHGMWELRPEIVAEYNTRLVNAPGVPRSVLAGDPLPTTCGELGDGDGVVSVWSATRGYPGSGLSPRVHTALTGAEDFTAFVLPRIVQRQDGAAPARMAMTGEEPAADPVQVIREEIVEVPAGETVELPVQVTDGARFGATAAVTGSFTIGLTTPLPATVAAAETDGSPFVTASVADPEAGTWTVGVSNHGSSTVRVPLAVWVTGSSTTLTVEASADENGRVTVTATRVGGDGDVEVILDGVYEDVDVELTDNGDGSFTGTSAPLAAGRWLAVARTSDRIASYGVTVGDGEDSKPTEPEPTVTATPSVPSQPTTQPTPPADGGNGGGGGGPVVTPSTPATGTPTAGPAPRPTLRCAATPNRLRADGRMVPVHVTCTLGGSTVAADRLRLVSARSSAPGDATRGLQGWTTDTSDIDGLVRAERDRLVRRYTFRYETGAGATATQATATVIVSGRAAFSTRVARLA